MLKNILNLKGIKELQKEDLRTVKGGSGYTVTCHFSDGGYWQGHTHDSRTAAEMRVHCRYSGGNDGLQIHGIWDGLVMH